MSGAARVELAFEMCHEAREIALQGIRSREPEIDAAEAEAQLLRRILGSDLWAAAYDASRA